MSYLSRDDANQTLAENPTWFWQRSNEMSACQRSRVLGGFYLRPPLHDLADRPAEPAFELVFHRHA